MQCHLVHLGGPMAGLALSFEQDRITVGSAANSDMRLAPPDGVDDDEASPLAPDHAEILFDDDERLFYLHDVSGRRGTLVNGERPAEPRTPLYAEDILQFGADGGPELIFRLGMAAPGLQPLPAEPEESGSLEFLTGAEAGRVYPVPAGAPVRIGRRADLEIALDPQGDLVVSGNHCAVERVADGFTVTDTSRNGTFVNDTQVEGTTYLEEGDILRLGEGGPRIRFRASVPRRVYPNLAFRTGGASAARPAGAIPQSRPVGPPVGAVPAPAAMPPHMAMPPAHRGDRIPAAPPQRTPKVPCKLNLLRHRPAHGGTHRALRQATVWWRTLLHDKRRRRPGLASRIARDGSLLLVAGVAAAMGYGLWRLGASRAATGKPTDGTATAKAAAAAAETLARQVASAGDFKVAKGAYSIVVPAGWRALENGKGALLEPPAPDTGLAVDFMRDARLKPYAARRLAAGTSGEAKAYPLPRAAANGEVAISAWGGRSGDLARIAVFHQPPGDVPLLAMLETTTATLASLPADTLDKLLISGVKLQRINPLPTPTPTPKPMPSATPRPETTPASGEPDGGTGSGGVRIASATATPGSGGVGAFGIKLPFGFGSGSAAATATPKPTAAGRNTPASTSGEDDPSAPTPRPIATTTPRSGARPTPSPVGTPEPETEYTPAPATARLTSRKAKLALRLPEKWSGASDEAQGTLAIKAPSGLSVRVARDEGKVEVESVIRGLVLDGYAVIGQPMKKAAYSAAVLRKGDDRVMVTLIPQSRGGDSTVVMYSKMNGAAIAPDDNKALGALVGQIIDGGKPAGR